MRRRWPSRRGAAHPRSLASGALLSIDDQELTQRATALSWLVLDVDGVLTDGHLFYGPEGEALKVFDVRDGLAIKLAQQAGLGVAILSGRRSAAVERRARELGIGPLFTGRENKAAAFRELLAEIGAEAHQIAYIGDDLPDLPVLRLVGLAMAPADAAREVRRAAHLVLAAAGGRGAVREAVERILQARGAWDRLVETFAAPAG